MLCVIIDFKIEQKKETKNPPLQHPWASFTCNFDEKYSH